MNVKHPYEKHLAEKLVQLPPPGDSDQNWQQMKVLLDKNMPRGGAGGPGGSYRWWIAGTVVIAVVVGTWFGGKQFITKEQRNEAVAGTIKTVNNKKGSSVASTEKNSTQQAVPQPDETDKNKTAGASDPRGAAYASAENNNAPVITDDNEGVADNNAANQNNTVTGSARGEQPVKNNSGNPVVNNGQTEKERSSANGENNTDLLAGNDKKTVVPETTNNIHNKTSSDRNKIYSSNKKTGGNNSKNNANTRRHLNERTGNQRVNTTATAPGVVKSKNAKRNKPEKNEASINVPGKEVEKEENRFVYLPSISLPSRNTSGAGLTGKPVVINVDYTGTAVIAPSGVLQREFTYYTQSDLFPDMAARHKSGSRKTPRSSEAHDDKKFAFGFSLPLTFPVGDQQALGFNRQAGANTISDYIPSPHFQYHFNNRTYLQTGLQFSTPQFIRPILLYQSEHMMQPNTVSINSVYARKLYYFNLPVSVYHSPLKNFYMGTGLQFSSMLSGVANYEQVKRYNSPLGPPQEYIISNYFTKFKNDSLSRRFNNNELRLLIDMSYYWNRFTVGLQYNQAFNNYVSFQVTPVSPYTFDKNKSLQFYLRYNIWEDNKRKMPKNKSMLTLK
jgi:hypothetical protein